jgi:hypothetical protein
MSTPPEISNGVVTIISCLNQTQTAERIIETTLFKLANLPDHIKYFVRSLIRL